MAGNGLNFFGRRGKGQNALELETTKASFTTKNGMASPTESLAPIIKRTKNGDRVEESAFDDEEKDFKVRLSVNDAHIANPPNSCESSPSN